MLYLDFKLFQRILVQSAPFLCGFELGLLPIHRGKLPKAFFPELVPSAPAYPGAGVP